MRRAVHTWYSPALGQEMTLHTYGDKGKPILIFPCQEGHYAEFEDFGMVAAVQPHIDSGRIHLICVDSVDDESWCNQSILPNARARRHNEYERYILTEVIPFIRARAPVADLLFSGCSMGGYHSANFYFRHPDVAAGFISLSGVYDLTLFIGDAMDEDIFYHTPLSYLPGMRDAWYLDRYREGLLVLCVGQGDWEEPMLTQTRSMEQILHHQGMRPCIDIWGTDVSHDWPWWRKQLPYFLDRFGV